MSLPDPQKNAIISLDFCSNEKFLVGKICEGGMGTVFQLIPIRIGGKTMALKRLKANVDENIFKNECEVWLSVSHHPHIAKALSFGKFKGAPAVLMPWYSSNLSTLDASNCTDDCILKLMCGVTEALEFTLSQTGMLHQDIKPANILLDMEGSPKLSDFGLARCSPHIPISETLLFYGKDKGTSTVGGTPFYMAPELFDGGIPNLRTDLFSWGVTFFQFFTSKHPYHWGASPLLGVSETGKTRLQGALSLHGSKIQSIGNMILQCLSIEPQKRPIGYSALGLPLDNDPICVDSPGDHDHSYDKITSIVAKAMLYREQGDFHLAEKLIKEHLDEHPDNPALLNAMGNLLRKQDRAQDAVVCYSKAVEILKISQGKYQGAISFDPVINLANLLRTSFEFGKAHSVYKIAWDWNIGLGSAPNLQTFYSEFGLMFLYEGNFENSLNYLKSNLEKKGADSSAIYCMLVAAWITDQMPAYADYVFKRLNLVRGSDPKAAFASCLAVSFLPLDVIDAFKPTLSDAELKEIEKAEQEIGFKKGSFLPPMPLDVQRTVIHSFDTFLTGGKNHEHIRKISKSRMG